MILAVFIALAFQNLQKKMLCESSVKIEKKLKTASVFCLPMNYTNFANFSSSKKVKTHLCKLLFFAQIEKILQILGKIYSKESFEKPKGSKSA